MSEEEIKKTQADMAAREAARKVVEYRVYYSNFKAVNGVMLTPYSAEFETQMATARKVMKKRRSVLRELAK